MSCEISLLSSYAYRLESGQRFFQDFFRIGWLESDTMPALASSAHLFFLSNLMYSTGSEVRVTV